MVKNWEIVLHYTRARTFSLKGVGVASKICMRFACDNITQPSKKSHWLSQLLDYVQEIHFDQMDVSYIKILSHFF